MSALAKRRIVQEGTLVESPLPPVAREIGREEWERMFAVDPTGPAAIMFDTDTVIFFDRALSAPEIEALHLHKSIEVADPVTPPDVYPFGWDD